MRVARLGLVAALCAGAGVALGWWVRGPGAEPAPVVTASDLEQARPHAAPTQRPTLGSAPATAPASPPAAGPPGAPPRPPAAPPSAAPPSASGNPRALLDADPAFVEARVREIAEGLRRSGQQQIDRAEINARTAVEQQIANERAARTDLERGEPFAFLRQLRRREAPPFEMLSTAAGLERFFTAKHRSAAVDGSRLRAEVPLEDGDRVLFPAGSFRLDVSHLNRQAAFPNDLTLEGQSMDETLVTLSDDLSSRADVHNLTLRDLTLDCGDNYLTDFRGVGITLRIERCRVVGFDMGAGGSVMLAGDCGVLLATDSRIEAGFGRSPGSGNLFRVRSGFLARLEGCTLVGPLRSVVDDGCYTFERCTFEGLAAADVERRPGQVRLVDCRFREGPAPEAHDRKQRLLSEINPAWAEPRR